MSAARTNRAAHDAQASTFNGSYAFDGSKQTTRNAAKLHDSSRHVQTRGQSQEKMYNTF